MTAETACRANQHVFLSAIPLSLVQKVANALRAEVNFTSQFNVIWVVQLARQNNPLHLFENDVLIASSRLMMRGRTCRHDTWSAGCGGRHGVARERDRRAAKAVSGRSRAGRATLLRTAKPCGPGARGWRKFGGGVAGPTGRANAVNSPMTEAKGIRLRGELGISRRTIAQGRPDALRWTCMLVCALLCANCTRDRG